MYVIRWNFNCKWGKEDVLIDALKKISAATGENTRIYSSLFGESQIIVSENEFPDAESAAKNRDSWFQLSPELASGANPDDVDIEQLGFQDAVTEMTVEMWHVESV